MDRDEARAWRIAGSQMWLITLAQLVDCGFSVDAVKHRVRVGRLWRVFPGVYSVGRPDLTPPRRALAAVLACSGEAALSLKWAAWNLAMWEDAPPRLPQVTVVTNDGRRGPRGIEMHKTASLAGDIRRHNGIPTTTVFRTLLDNAAHLSEPGIKSMLRQAQRKHRITLSSVSRYLEDRPRQATGPARLRRALATYLPKSVLTQTEREAMFFELCHAHGLPLPEPQYPVADKHADFAWPRYRLIVELDDRESHEGQIQHGEDLIRDRIFRAAGFHVERFTVAEAINQPDLVAGQLRTWLSPHPPASLPAVQAGHMTRQSLPQGISAEPSSSTSSQPPCASWPS